MAYEVTEGVLAGSTAVEVCSGLTGAPALEADEKGVASRVRRVFDHATLIIDFSLRQNRALRQRSQILNKFFSHCDKILGTRTKVLLDV